MAPVIIARSLEPYLLFLTASAIYLVMTYSILFVFKKVEFWLSGHLRERSDESILR